MMTKTDAYLRFVPATYFDLIKGEWLDRLCYQEEQANATTVVLGGKYRIVNKSGFIDIVCAVEPGGYFIQKKNLILESTIQLDKKISVGENVIFSPICSKKEIKYLSVLCNDFYPGKMYKVNKVINQIYIVLTDHQGKKSIPLRWLDLTV
jgi:hypothetical protein